MYLRYKELHWLLSRSSPLSINNKLLYKTVIAPIWTYGLELWGCASQSNSNHSEVPIKTTESNCKRPIVYHHCNDPLRPGHPYRSRCHPQKKQQAPSQTTFSSKSTFTVPVKGQYHTGTKTMANSPVIRSKRFPHWRKPHHVRKSTGWTLASSLAYGIPCTPITDQRK
jgi:hypothetical protein